MENEEQFGEIFLALDGCRTLGFSQILVLREIMHRIQAKSVLEEIPRVSDRASLVGGSGMGGLISIFMGRLRMETEDAVKAYERFCNGVYRNGNGTTTMAKYNWVVFEEVFKAIAKDAGFDADDPMEEENPSCKTVVFAVNAKDPTVLQAIRSYRVHSGPNLPFTILQAARATMASPDLFSPVSNGTMEGDEKFVANFTNPINAVLEEAGRALDDTAKVACVLSLGSGIKKVQGLPGDPQANGRVEMLATIARSCETAHQEAISRYSHSRIYHRINVEKDIFYDTLDEWDDDFTHIKRATRNHLQANVKSLDRVVDRFVRRIGGPKIRDLNRLPALGTVFPPPPSLSQNFVGRSDLVQAIITYHLSPLSPSTGGHWTTVLYGVGGIGKTQLAIKVWHELHSRNPNLLVFFLDARSTLTLENGLTQLIRSRNAQFWDKDYRDAVLWLATTKTPWLAILDNADDPEMELSPYLPRGEGNHMMITSRNPVRRVLAPHSNHEVGTLGLEDSTNLLLSISRFPATDENKRHAQDITTALHYHSLAIVQAGGYLLNNRRLPEYLTILNQKHDELFSEEHPEEQEYSLTVYASFQLSFDQLPGITQDTLWVFSFLNSTQIDEDILIKAAATSFIQDSKDIDTIPYLRVQLEQAAQTLKQLFCPSGEWDPDDFSQLLSPSIQYSLLTVTETDKNQIFYSIHPLVELFLRDTLPSEKNQVPELSVRLIASIIRFEKSGEALVSNQRLLPHIEAISAIRSITTVDRYALATVLHDAGRGTTAERHIISALNELGGMGIPPENRLLLTMRVLNGLILRDMGKYDAALEIQEETFQICSERFGDAHPDTLVSMNYLATTLKHQGNHSRALQLLEQGVRTSRRVLGDKHPDTLTAMNHLASTLKSQGNYSKAAELEELVLETRRQLLGDEHPHTLTTMNNLALTLQIQGNYSAASKLQERVLEMRKKVAGDEHPDTLSSMNNLAVTLRRQGDFSRAAALQGQVLEMSKRVLGDEHPTTLTSMGNLAWTLHSQGNYSRAGELQERVLEMWRRVSEGEHPEVLNSMTNLASTLRNQGNYSRAAELEEQVLETRRRVWGDKHPDTLNAMNNLASTLKSQGNYSKAAELEEGALETRRRVLGDEHPYTLTAMNNFALTLQSQGKYSRATELQERILEMRKRVSGDEHPDTLTSMNNLTVTLLKQRDFSRAAALQGQALEMSKRVLGDEHPTTLTSMGNLAWTLHNQGNYSRAAELHERVLEMRKRISGDEHPDTLTSMNGLAFTLRAQGNYTRAIWLLTQVRNGRAKVLGGSHPHTLQTEKSLAFTVNQAATAGTAGTEVPSCSPTVQLNTST